jgi:hypothetical protein
MRVTLPHTLGREEVRRRLRERSPEIADHIPGGMAQVNTQWNSEDVMHLSVAAMGQNLEGNIEVMDDNVVIDFELPPALSFFKPIIERALRDNGQKLLENDR